MEEQQQQQQQQEQQLKELEEQGARLMETVNRRCSTPPNPRCIFCEKIGGGELLFDLEKKGTTYHRWCYLTAQFLVLQKAMMEGLFIKFQRMDEEVQTKLEKEFEAATAPQVAKKKAAATAPQEAKEAKKRKSEEAQGGTAKRQPMPSAKEMKEELKSIVTEIVVKDLWPKLTAKLNAVYEMAFVNFEQVMNAKIAGSVDARLLSLMTSEVGPKQKVYACSPPEVVPEPTSVPTVAQTASAYWQGEALGAREVPRLCGEVDRGTSAPQEEAQQVGVVEELTFDALDKVVPDAADIEAIERQFQLNLAPYDAIQLQIL
jgi:hypothetical protein